MPAGHTLARAITSVHVVSWDAVAWTSASQIRGEEVPQEEVALGQCWAEAVRGVWAETLGYKLQAPRLIP